MTPEERDIFNRAWDYEKHWDTMFVYRLNYSMVAQSMLIVSYSTLASVSVQNIDIKLIQIIICIFGIFYTYLQHILAKSLGSQTRYVRENYVEKIDQIYKEIRLARKLPLKNVQNFWIPGLLATTWVIFLGISIIR